MAEYSTRDLAGPQPSVARSFDNNDRRPPAAASFARDLDNNARTLPIASPISNKQPSPAAAADKKIVLKSADMKEDMQKEAIDCAIAAFEKLTVEKEIAEHIKKDFDKKHGPTWHCIVGRNFETSKIVSAQSDLRALTTPKEYLLKAVYIPNKRAFNSLFQFFW